MQGSAAWQLCLESTGVVSGEFGMVDALRGKKAEMVAWFDDPRPRVKTFAEAYIRHLDQRMASERRSAEQRKELRKRNFDEGNG